MNIIGETERLRLVVFEESHTEPAKLFWGDTEVMKLCGGSASVETLPKTIEFYHHCHENNNLSV